MPESVYYRAVVERKQCWFFTGVLRSFEHLVFDRTCDVSQSLFEFFVPYNNEKAFLELMHFFIQEGIVRDLQKIANPFKQMCTSSALDQ